MIAKQARNRVLLYMSIALLASQAAAGAGQTPMYTQPTLPGKGVAGPDHNPQHAFADQAFVKSVLERDIAEEQLGQLAQQKSQSPDIQQLGAKMVENRTTLDNQFKIVATALDVSLPKGPTKKDNQLIARLSELSGAQFDEEYIKVVAKSNRQDVKDFQAESQIAEDPTLLYAAQQDAPVISKHLQAIEDVARAHNVAIDAKK
jgi:putative membrane protein